MSAEHPAALARVDAAIAAFDRGVNGSVDDFVLAVLSWLSPEQIAAFLLISEDEALDIFARLSERGFIEEAKAEFRREDAEV